MKKILKKVFLIIILLYFGIIGSNFFNGKFEDLSQLDQNVLKEFAQFSKSPPLWKNYELKDRSLLFINKGVLGHAYIINPKNKPSGLFAKEIDIPGGGKAYRISGLLPGVLKIKLDPGNFNSIEDNFIFKANPKILGTPVYFLKYNEESITEKNSSSHFMPFLAHEAFHFYMQKNWQEGSRFKGKLSDKDIELIGEEYNVLAKMQKAKLENKKVNWENLAKEYVKIMDERIKENPSYLKDEMAMETIEGTATYVGIKAAKDVDYDFGVMYFSNKKNVSFQEVIPAVKSGAIQKNFLADRMPYETGAQLCFLLDNLGVSDWQGKLNEQSKDKPVLLYDLIREAVEER